MEKKKTRKYVTRRRSSEPENVNKGADLSTRAHATSASLQCDRYLDFKHERAVFFQVLSE